MPLISIDFDGTIAGSDANWPSIGNEVTGAIDSIRKLHNHGICIIINTCRVGSAYDLMVDWLKCHGVPYCRINCNCEYRIKKYGGDCRKISADCYIDDKSICCLLNGVKWDIMYEDLIKLFGDCIHTPNCLI